MNYKMTASEKIDSICNGIKKWLENHNNELESAIAQTLKTGRFTRNQINHQLKWIKEKVTSDGLYQFLNDADTNPWTESEDWVLVLHAGNLPMVGFQDVLAVLLSGKKYWGKISRKDAFLLPSLLKVLSDDLPDFGKWSTDLNDLDKVPNQIMFTGDEKSLIEIRKSLNAKKRIGQRTEWLIRKANFSAAIWNPKNSKAYEELAEAVLTFDGNGCRSVAVVFSKRALEFVSCGLMDALEAFLVRNPSKKQKKPLTDYQFAFNKAIERPQMLIEHVLIQQCESPELENPDVLNWIVADEKDAEEICRTFGERLQTLYINSLEQSSITSIRTEILGTAQFPELNWQPDGISTLAWLLHKNQLQTYK